MANIENMIFRRTQIEDFFFFFTNSYPPTPMAYVNPLFSEIFSQYIFSVVDIFWCDKEPRKQRD